MDCARSYNNFDFLGVKVDSFKNLIRESLSKVDSSIAFPVSTNEVSSHLFESLDFSFSPRNSRLIYLIELASELYKTSPT